MQADFDSDMWDGAEKPLKLMLIVQEMGKKVDEHRARVNMLEKELQVSFDQYLEQQREELHKQGLAFESIEQELTTLKTVKLAEIKEYVKSFGESNEEQNKTPVLAAALAGELDNEINCGDATLKLLALRLASEKLWLAMWTGFWEQQFELFYLQLKENKK